ncbi:uncharacterized protein LOC131348277 isoform X2 [Hemibagrus wyckioides]|uniref:uncharacterized protein LOC131348277 isoform X2 n=1 Tax=Hemibagrus wyckioides TaxID=337641 RepID=UPI00266C2BAB|nr:uncharacterized protein LOC131348277 isoform X2 [Hemibagrus wyckioides]
MSLHTCGCPPTVYVYIQAYVLKLKVRQRHSLLLCHFLSYLSFEKVIEKQPEMSVSCVCFSHFGEHNRTDTGCTSILQTLSPGKPSADICHQLKPFTPHLVKNCEEDEYRFFCPCPGQFLCEFTNIVFEMESEGEVKYRIMSWDNWLLNNLPPPKKPAGPLYNIDGPKDSILRLHFPHCETGKGKAKLAVAHVSDGKVEIIQPQTVTDTHVIINIQSLCPFGLISPWNTNFIRAQVLLFYKKFTEHNKSKLNIHLLPANVPVKEVQKQYKSYTYIVTTASCELKPRTRYKLRCITPDSVLQSEKRQGGLDTICSLAYRYRARLTQPGYSRC